MNSFDVGYAGDSVLHVRYATRPGSPWRGVSPLGMVDETRALAGWLEKRLPQEASTLATYVMPVPDGVSENVLPQVKTALSGGGGGSTHLVETTAQGWGQGENSAAPKGDWDAKRLGANPPSSLISLRGKATVNSWRRRFSL